jgi:FKBP-type peptidyl-prolyl cis-trans isomerase 2
MSTEYAKFTLLFEVNKKIEGMKPGDEMLLEIKDPRFFGKRYAKKSSVVSTTNRIAREKGWRVTVILTKYDKFPRVRRLA